MNPPPAIPIPANPGYRLSLHFTYPDGSTEEEEWPVLAWLWYGDDWAPDAMILAEGRPTTLRDYLVDLADLPGVTIKQEFHA